ncbi:MAG: aminotransferase class V-fold PLP-dependent enzyme [Planctomycetota bacterium]|jgi:kynureninase|nr:aminotransferase class V-fold PLP-dependent enzyme [Planctomycetota bacterium]MDP6763210.1 aminotransferase class V-fold PLP-dependent enzyme [Planctomycetota bacterium]MDP6990581.1 aminotransferase class V-fold PLP-dependent enzyme [Planctomycetota bacterium]
MTDELRPEDWRDRFPILEGCAYLVTHSLGAMPRGVYDKLGAFADQWAERGVRAWAEGWWTAPVDVGDLVGRIMNAPEGTVAMHQNVSVIQSIVASALDFSGRRNKVVYSDQNFPTNMYVWEALRAEGARIVEVPGGSVDVPTERMVEAIDEETLIVPLSHVCFKTSYLQDAEAICARAREVGALVLLDTYQSLGTVPLDVTALGVDMVCGGSVKWLCGGPGAAYLYVRPDLIERLAPRVTGWMAHADPFAFETGPQRHAEGIERFLHGSPAVASLLQATAGYEVILEAGVERIRAHSVALTEGLRARMLERGFEVNSVADPNRRGGTLTIGLHEQEDGAAYVAALAERGMLVDHRPGAGIRVSPHFYTRAEELEAFADHMSELRESGAWRDGAAAAGRY